MNTIYPKEIVDRLIDWCAEHAADRPWPVTIVGLSYGYALSRAQILAARRVAGGQLLIDFPLARGGRGARHAERATILVAEPDWLVSSIGGLVTGDRTELVLRPQFLGAATASRERLKLELRRASVEATSFELSPERLCKTGIVHAHDHGFHTAAIGVGYRPTVETMIMHHHRHTVMPFRP